MTMPTIVPYGVYTHKSTSHTSRVDIKTTSSKAIQIFCNSSRTVNQSQLILNRKYKRLGDSNQFVTPCQFLPITPSKTRWRQADRGGGWDRRDEGKRLKMLTARDQQTRPENRKTTVRQRGCGVRDEKKKRVEKERWMNEFINQIYFTKKLLCFFFFILEQKRKLRAWILPKQHWQCTSCCLSAVADSRGLRMVIHITQAHIILLPSECQIQMTDKLYLRCCAKNIPNHELESTTC